VKLQPPTILVHFEDLETLLMTSKMCIVLCTICLSVPIPASTLLTEFLYISCCKRLSQSHFLLAPSLLAPGGVPLPSQPPPLLRFYNVICFLSFWLCHRTVVNNNLCVACRTDSFMLHVLVCGTLCRSSLNALTLTLYLFVRLYFLFVVKLSANKDV